MQVDLIDRILSEHLRRLLMTKGTTPPVSVLHLTLLWKASSSSIQLSASKMAILACLANYSEQLLERQEPIRLVASSQPSAISLICAIRGLFPKP